ncbi:MAG: GtrA family protein [Acidimicrobiia bacterium]|nr:GtrA family protein [Acidimicrobiia bacterium]
MSARVRAFVVVGAMGFVTQIAALAVLTHVGVPLPLATALAVEAAVLHNFVWHQRWTWRDREGHTGWGRRLVRFHSANAVASIVVNVMLTWAIARWFNLPAPVANAFAVVATAGVNFMAADRWVFARRASATAVVGLLAVSSGEATPPPSALSAWDAYVREAEQRGTAEQDCRADAEPAGDATQVDGGTIYRWSGCTLIKGATVAALVNALVTAGTPPPQDDVLESRLLGREGERLRVYLKLQRRSLVTVSYDTEHDVTFSRTSAGLATSRSVSTVIREVAGGDRGFLWKLNSYWTYQQVGSDVRVTLVSLSLSRDVPTLLRPMAGPIIASVARQSVVRTLGAVKQFAQSSVD